MKRLPSLPFLPPRRLVRAAAPAVLATALAGLASAVPQGVTVNGRTVQKAGPLPTRSGTVQDPVADTLHAMGVNTAPTHRKDEMGNDLDEDYAPLGSQVVLNRTDELIIVGLDEPGDDFQRSFWLYQDGSAGPGPFGYEPEVLFDMGPNEMEDYRPSTSAGNTPQSYRAVAAADVDGDGLQETIVLFHDGTDLRLRLIEDEVQGNLVTEQVLTTDPAISDVAVCGADFDGDGMSEIVAAWGVDGIEVKIRLLNKGAGPWTAVYQAVIPPSLPGSEFALVVESGNVDNDRHEEIALIIDENDAPTAGLCRWFLHDDQAAGFAPLGGGPLRSTDGGVERTAVVGDVAMGDIDGDGRDEVVFAGLTAWTTGCVQPDYLVLALDDAVHGLVELGTKHFSHTYATTCSGGPKMVRWAHVNTGDFDADGRDEIQMNQFVYDDWVAGGTFTPQWTLPATVVMANTATWQYFDRSTSAFAVGDYTGNGHDDIITVRNGVHSVHVYGLDVPNPDPDFVEQGYLEMEAYTAQWGFSNPLLVAVNVDADSPVLSYSEGKYEFVFTEPIVIAALAAPPYQLGILQNYDACSTSFGNTTSTGSEFERSVSLSAGATVGVNVDGGPILQAEFEASMTSTVTASFFASNSYQLDKTVIFTSGWQEDLVVFTTIPMDVYTYKVLSHPDPAAIGGEVQLRYPRSPIILQADREYYNEHLFEGGMEVGIDVFQHTIGDVDSYPNAFYKNALLAVYGGLQSNAVSVGIGTGSTTTEIAVSNAMNVGGALEIAYEAEVKATAGGVMSGFTVGASASVGLSISSGSQTTYTGTVGAIQGPDFPANAYSFGLFTYVLPEPSGLYEFEVLNYWVE